MPSKKKKYNARFPAGRIKKIMQMDDDVGKIAHGVPVVISRSVELFIHSLLEKTASITRERNAKTLSQAHFKLCILREQKFDFLKDLVRNIEDVSPEEEKKPPKSNFNLPTSSTTELSSATNHRQIERKRIRSESDFECSSSSVRIERPAAKKRFLDSSSTCPLFNQINETSYSPVEVNIDYNSHYNSTETNTEHRDSCDLVIDEDCDT